MTKRTIRSAILVVLVAGLLALPTALTAAPFVRGDVNADGTINLTDPTVVLAYLFQGGREPPCLAAADANSSGDLDLSDGIYLLLFLFANGESPRAPYPDCGYGDGEISCLSYPPCVSVDDTVTLFDGGTLEELEALSPQLSFDHLVIDGRLNLPLRRTVRLNVNKLTITPEGSIRTSRTSCEYGPGPTLLIRGQRVVIDGEIQVGGVSGTRTTDTASCNQCTGTAGGRVDILADHIEIGAVIDTSGGAGSTSVSTGLGGGSSGCRGGNGGQVHLEASVLDLTGSAISTFGGNGGSGSFQGIPSPGPDGNDGSIELVASDVLMNGGSARTDGVLTLRADRTEIYGVLEGELADTVGGAPDDEPPVIEILSPTTGDTVSLSEPLRIRVELYDTGSGVRELQVTGLGLEETVSIRGVEDHVFTLPPLQALPPAWLQITAVDNTGQSATHAVDDLVFTGDLTLGVGQKITLSAALVLPADSLVDISGEVVLKNGRDHSIQAGSLTISETGRIVLEEETDRPAGKAPSLAIGLGGTATIEGTIDLSGRPGTPTTNEEQGGEDGGDLTCLAENIVVTGSVLSNGGRAVTRTVYEEMFGQVEIAAPGGAGGAITLEAARDVIVSGTVSIEGGRSRNSGFGGCFDGGDGGEIIVSFGGVADFTGGVFDAEGGYQGGPVRYSCGTPLLGAPGHFALWYTGNAAEPPVPIVVIEEREPNWSRVNAHGVAFGAPTVINGRASRTDDANEGDFWVDTKGVTDRVEDFYLIHLTTDRQLLIVLDPAEDDVDLDLLLINYLTGEIVAYSIQPGGETEALSGVLGAGFYMLAVSWWDGGSNAGSDYKLAVLPTN